MLPQRYPCSAHGRRAREAAISLHFDLSALMLNESNTQTDKGFFGFSG
jgi:hypothetical protein